MGDTGIHDEARYHRQALLPGIGRDGQARLVRSHALIVGCGALGTVAAESLCRAGVGTITVIDRDVVEPSNLQRQTLFDERDARDAAPKAVAAAARLRAINSGVRVVPMVRDFTHRTAPRILDGADPPAGVVLDCTDNFQTRYLVNDLCVSRGNAYVYAGAVGTVGMCRAVLPRVSAPGCLWPGELATPCLRCLFEHPPAPGASPTCDTAGVLSPAPGIAALLQTAEAIKMLLGRFDLVRRTLVVCDVWDGPVRELGAGGAFDPRCPCCVGRDFPWLDGRMDSGVTTLCGRNAVQVTAALDESPGSLDHSPDLRGIGDRLRAHGEVLASASLVRCRLWGERPDAGMGGEPVEITVFADGRAVVRGTRDPSRARSIYARFVGA